MSVRVELMLPTYLLEYKAPSHFPVVLLILKKPPRVNRLWQLTRNSEYVSSPNNTPLLVRAHLFPPIVNRSNSLLLSSKGVKL
jgi:hypothetical protein